jgi:hypothetical protein
VADVVIGSFRYCVNEPDNAEIGRKVYPLVANLMWKFGGKIEEFGLKMRPQESSHHAHRYDGLLDRLEKYLVA